MLILNMPVRLITAYEEQGPSGDIVQILEYLGGGQLFEKIIESPYGKSVIKGDFFVHAHIINIGVIFICHDKVLALLFI